MRQARQRPRVPRIQPPVAVIRAITLSARGRARWTPLVSTDAGCLERSMKVEGRHAEIDEARLAVSKFKFLRWGEGAEWEAGCALINMQVTISPRACKCSDRALVVINLHALERRYERGQDNSDSAT